MPDTAQASALEKVTSNPINTYIGQLANGLTVYLSVNKEEPRIQTNIAVKAGFQDDPDDATGLAHYLEHMMFKGSDRIGTQNWESESRLLDQIENLYEEHRQTSDPEEKKRLYTRIDELSAEAAQYAVPNEYDKLISTIGAKGTNAYTSFDQTVFLNDIPANELEKWLKIESERFRKLVLRLFHTELETVYEEFNMRNQDSDQVKIFDALFDGLFQNHNYGRQPSIGKPEHLKNPSMKAVYRFFNTYYSPNNMAICMSGDLDPDATLEMVDQYFGGFQPTDLPDRNIPKEEPFTEPVIREVWGNEAENVTMAFRFGGAKTEEVKLMRLVEGLLFNQKAGIIDLELNQQQKVMEAVAGYVPLKDHSILLMNGTPKTGQSLQEVREALLETMEKIKNGQFEEWQLEAVINDLKLKQKSSFARNKGRADAFVDAFTNEVEWNNYVQQLEEMAEITREDIMAFARERFDNSYVVVNKRQGTDPNTVRLEKPPITPVKLNRDVQSDFYQEVRQIETPSLSPRFLNFQEDIRHRQFQNQIPFYYIPNTLNDTFKLYYILDIGTDHNRAIELALHYLTYLGTDQYSPEAIRQEFFRLGLSYHTDFKKDQTFLFLQGLEEHVEEGIALFEHLLANVQPNADALEALISNLIKEREDEQSDKNVILREALVNFGKYGPDSPFTYRLSKDEMLATKPEDLTRMIQSLTSYQHRIFYYGQKKPETVENLLGRLHRLPEQWNPSPEPKTFEEQPTDSPMVYFMDYNMVQSEMVLLTKDEPFRKDLLPYGTLFNEYFGGGLSSIVYQEIRESKALAYTAFSFFTTPRTKMDSHYVLAYLGTQSDKLKEALDALKDLMENMPEAEDQFENAKHSVLKRLSSERITQENIFWAYEDNKRKGIDEDNRRLVYETVQKLTLADLKAFYEKHVKGNDYHYLVLGSKEHMDFSLLESIGEVRELSLEEVFQE